MQSPAQPAPATAHEKRRQITPLTGVRGVACVWVLAFHGYLILKGYGATGERDFLYRGYLGVDLFFVLSGFVLAMTYGTSFARLRQQATKRFYIGRALRILPLHWTVLGAFAAVTPMMSGIWWLPSPHTLQRWLASFLLVQSWTGRGYSWNSPAWSLSAEWGAYLAFPLLAWMASRVQSGALALALAAASLSLLAALTFLWYGTFSYVDPGVQGLLRCATEFIAGMLMFRLVDIAPEVRRWGDASMVLGLTLLVGALAFRQMDVPAPFGFALIVLSCWSEARIATVLFGNRVVAWLGEISFSLYIVHWLLIECAFGLLAGGPHGSRDPATATAAVTLALVSAVPIAALLYRYVERPSHRLGHHMLRRERRVAGATGASVAG